VIAITMPASTKMKIATIVQIHNRGTRRTLPTLTRWQISHRAERHSRAEPLFTACRD
jgi:hypothetical protein